MTATLPVSSKTAARRSPWRPQLSFPDQKVSQALGINSGPLRRSDARCSPRSILKSPTFSGVRVQWGAPGSLRPMTATAVLCGGSKHRPRSKTANLLILVPVLEGTIPSGLLDDGQNAAFSVGWTMKPSRHASQQTMLSRGLSCCSSSVATPHDENFPGLPVQ